ncbi:hypothetical protein RUM44_012638 [Polyplax serrata]|uniref:THUMP domain-containing protein n=1 Tax=Polyplax serrata TaxID=468196 RepID=A0ABR1BG96_POLSC
MIDSYYSSDDDDELDDFYSDPFVKFKNDTKSPEFSSKEIRDEFLSALETSKKISLFTKSIYDDVLGDKISILEKLIASGVSVESCNEPLEWTPLMKACSMGKSEVVAFLLQQGANPNLHKELFTPLMACCSSTCFSDESKLNCVQYLLQYGADVNATDKYRMTALMYAVQTLNHTVVDFLLTVPGLMINLQDKEGSSALFYAVINNNLELVKKLVDAGSDTTLIDRYGRTVLNIALLKEFQDVAKILGLEENHVGNSSEKYKLNDHPLNELPSPNGTGGFSSDVETILSSRTLAKSQVKVSLPEFLNATEDDLFRMGIPFHHDRMKLLKYTIHRYHLKPWKKSSMPAISMRNKKITDAVEITSSILKHLTLANATLTYIRARILARLSRNPDHETFEKEVISALISTYNMAERMKLVLGKTLKHFSKVDICLPDDFISTKDRNKIISQNWIQCVVVVAAATAAAISVFCHLQTHHIPCLKNKSQYKHFNKKRSHQLECGFSGFLCTYNNKLRERNCIREACGLLNEFADKLFGTEGNSPTEIELEADEGNDNVDIDESIKREVESIKAMMNKKPEARRFQAVESGAKGIVFIRTTVPDPVKLAYSIMLSMSDVQKSKFLLRLLPVEITCKAYLDDICKAFTPLCNKYFGGDPKTFAVVFNHRNNDRLKRDDVIEKIADLVVKQNGEHKADLKNPELVVLIEVIRSMCCISVVPEFYTLKKYNLLELVLKNRDTSNVDVKSEVEKI